MAEEDNLTRQIEEVEALSSIYGEEWCTLEESKREYSIQICDPDKQSYNNICLQICLPVDYPALAPPNYQLSAPWLKTEDRRAIENELADIYIGNIGECVIYLWVEKIREFIQTLSDESTISETSSPEKSSTKSSSTKAGTISSEEDGSDDDELMSDFDLQAVELSLTEIGISEQDDDKDWECPAIIHGQKLVDRKSVFQGHLAQVFHPVQVNMVLSSLFQDRKIEMATHNIYAFRILKDGEKGASCIQNCVDDGEVHAGSRLLHLLQIVDAKNVMVVVTRWYGGIHLGPDRFKHINNCARILLLENGYIQEKKEKKKPKTSGKRKR